MFLERQRGFCGATLGGKKPPGFVNFGAVNRSGENLVLWLRFRGNLQVFLCSILDHCISYLGSKYAGDIRHVHSTVLRNRRTIAQIDLVLSGLRIFDKTIAASSHFYIFCVNSSPIEALW